MNNHKPFKYGNYTFVPYRKFNNSETGDYLVKRIYKNSLFDKEYSYTEFYNKAQNSDIFICLDNLELVIPGSVKLFSIKSTDLIEDENCYEDFIKHLEEQGLIDYHRLLCRKIDKEFNDYKAKMLEKTPDEIINLVYEIAVKQELVFHIESSSTLDSSQEISKKLFKYEYPLDDIYMEWISNDLTAYDLYESTICELVNKGENQ